MNTALKRDGRQSDGFVLATENSVNWANNNRRTTLMVGALALGLVLVLAGAYGIYQHRVAAAQTALGDALQVYQTPVARPGQAVRPGVQTFPSVKVRATKANALFTAVAGKYSLTEPGKLAEYFSGLTFAEADQPGPAEDALKKAAGSWNGDVSALAKDALAQFYAQNGREGEAVALLQQLSKGHATTVPPELAQLQLADMYTAEGKTEQGRQIYAQLKDHDKDVKGKPGFAAQLAERKLNPSAPAAGPR